MRRLRPAVGHARTPLGDVAHTLIHLHRDRTRSRAFALMAAQAFFYNAIFTYSWC